MPTPYAVNTRFIIKIVENTTKEIPPGGISLRKFYSGNTTKEIPSSIIFKYTIISLIAKNTIPPRKS